MTKELSIESIKKELIDKFVNNMEILRYLEIEKQDCVKLSEVQNTFIYNYDNPNVTGNFITVDVAEHVSFQVNIRDSVKYIVSIKIGLEHANNLDKIVAVIKKIVLELYPFIKVYNNVPVYVKKYGYTYSSDCHEHNELNRVITFEIKE